MATKKQTSTDEKFEKQDFDLFEALAALDRKDYNYFDKLTEEQQKKFVPYMMLLWMSCIKGNESIQRYYLMAVNEYANKHFFDEHIMKHPKLQWMMLCTSSPGVGKQFHQWIPHLSSKITNLKDIVKTKEIKEYYNKIYPKTSNNDLELLAEAFVEEHNKKVYLANKFPELKISDIEVLSQFVSKDDIDNYERELGNK